jgi:hypothetical protein
MREQVCSDSICGQKQSFFSYLRSKGYYFEKGWYCSRLCLLRAVTVSVRRSLELPTPEILIHRRGRIGAILIQKGLISREELERALRRQQSEGGLIGKWLVALTEISEAQLMSALSEQQGVPWLAKATPNINKSLMGLLPKKLCVDYRILPFEFNQEGEALRVAAKSPIDGLLLHMLRSMLGYEIHFFIVSDSVFDEMVAAHLEDRNDEIIEEEVSRRSAGEISDLIVERIAEYGLRRLSVHFLNNIFWIRASQGRKWRDFFISVPSPNRTEVDKIAGMDRQFLPSKRAKGAIPAGNQASSVGT